jgi:flagellar biosynthesis/type III secretory pathway ATPase
VFLKEVQKKYQSSIARHQHIAVPAHLHPIPHTQVRDLKAARKRADSAVADLEALQSKANRLEKVEAAMRKVEVQSDAVRKQLKQEQVWWGVSVDWGGAVLDHSLLHSHSHPHSLLHSQSHSHSRHPFHFLFCFRLATDG